MMNCKEVKNKLIFYYYDELQPDEKLQIEKHLQTCISCRQDYQKLAAILNYASFEAQTQPNPFLWTRIKAKIHQHPPEVSPLWNKILQPVLISLAITLGVLLGVKLGQIYSTKDIIDQQITTSYFDQQGLFISYDQLDQIYLFDNNLDAKTQTDGNTEN